MESKSKQRPTWVQLYFETSNAGLTCRRCGISRPTLRKRVKRYEQLGIEGLASLRSSYGNAHGRTVEGLERHWQIKNMSGIEERWRDDLEWLLAGLSDILDLKPFYYHPKEHYVASPDRIVLVKKLFQRLRHQTYDLREQFKYCSPLGVTLPRLRSAQRGSGGQRVGLRTIRTLEAAGYDSPGQLSKATVTDLIRCGVRPKFAREIENHFRQRTR